jgi:hypothetical protein
LRTARDLFVKLERDLIRLQSNRLDGGVAFDFFVTAYHMLDWIHPGYANKKTRQGIENGELLLQIASDLADGSKHFVLEAKKHKSVDDATRQDRAFGDDAFDTAFDTSELVILLKGDAAARFGSSVSVLKLAKEMVEYWKQQLPV